MKSMSFIWMETLQVDNLVAKTEDENKLKPLFVDIIPPSHQWKQVKFGMENTFPIIFVLQMETLLLSKGMKLL